MRTAGLHCRNPDLPPMLYRKTLPHHGRTFYGSLQLSRLFQKMHAFGRQMFSLCSSFQCFGVCVSVYYITLRPAFPLIGTCFAALGMVPGAFLTCSCLAGLALLAVRHALVRHYCTDILLFQGNGYRHIPRSRMGCPAGGKHLLPLFTLFDTLKRKGGKRHRQRQQTPAFRRNGPTKETIGLSNSPQPAQRTIFRFRIPALLRAIIGGYPMSLTRSSSLH